MAWIMNSNPDNIHEASAEGIIFKIDLKRLYEHINLSLVFFLSHNAHLVKCSGTMVFLKLVASKA